MKNDSGDSGQPARHHQFNYVEGVVKLVDADALIQHLRFNDAVAYSTPEVTIMEFLEWAPPVECESCKHWNGARMDDWGCCESEELSYRLDFTTQMSSKFGCAFYQAKESK